MKKLFVMLGLVVIVFVTITAASASSLLFDRGLPTQNLNDSAGADRSNIAWADSSSTSGPTSYYLYGDDFKIGTSGTYNIDRVTIWTVYFNSGLKLYGGTTNGTITELSSSYTSQSVFYPTTNEGYQATSGAYETLYQIDFTTNWNVTGGQEYQFFLYGVPSYYEPYNKYMVPFLHASNKDLSGSPQEYANNLILRMSIDNGVVGSISSLDTNGFPWDKSSDCNIQLYGSPVPLPGAIWLLGSGLLGLGGWRRFRKG